MHRNKHTETMSHDDLTPLTEYILAQMGAVGSDIRRRLKRLYRRRLKNLPCIRKGQGKTV